jgi:hypothetical protein
MNDIDIMIACIPVLVLTIFFMILITFRIHDTSTPVDISMSIDPNLIGIDGLS